MGIDESPKRKKRKADTRKREEKRWSKKNGPVTRTWVDPRQLLMERVNEETALAAAGEGGTCHEDMGSDPCGKPAVGERIDPTYGGSYPVCAEHLRPPLP